MHVCMYVGLFAFMHVCKHVCMHLYIYMCVCVCMPRRMGNNQPSGCFSPSLFLAPLDEVILLINTLTPVEQFIAALHAPCSSSFSGGSRQQLQNKTGPTSCFTVCERLCSGLFRLSLWKNVGYRGLALPLL